MGIHHLMVGTWTPPGAIFTFAFDDVKLTLQLIKRTEIAPDEPISWMTFDHTHRTLYGAALKKWSSFTISSPTTILPSASHPMTHHPLASSAATKTRAIFLLAARKPPFHVYCNPFYSHAGHGTIFSVTPDESVQDPGSAHALDKVVQHFEYDERASVHGMVFDAEERYLYSADMWGNRIWTHVKHPTTGLVETVGSIDAPEPGDHPRWVEIGPGEKYLYVLMEAGNRLCVYEIVDGEGQGQGQGKQGRVPRYTGRSYPLVPPSMLEDFKGLYRSDVVFLSASGRYLFATARSNSASLTGYISAFELREDGDVGRQICCNPTTTSGGHSNAVAPCPWSDEWVALTDDEKGGIEMFRWRDGFLGRVCRWEMRVEERERDKGFGMNAIWYD